MIAEPPGYDYDREDPTFPEDLRASQSSVDAVAAWLRRQGHVVHVPPLRLRPTVDRMRDYSDRGDMFLVAPGRRYRVEVSTRGAFSSRATFPHALAIVCQRHVFDGACRDATQLVPHVYVLTNTALTAAFVFNVEATRAAWAPFSFVRCGRWKHVYRCAPALAQFVRLDAVTP